MKYLILIELIGLLFVIQLIFLILFIRNSYRITKNYKKNNSLEKTFVTHENEQNEILDKYSLRTYYNDKVLRDRQRKLENKVFES